MRLTRIDGPANDPVASRSGRLVYARTTSDHNIWGLNLNQPAAEPKQLVASTYADEFPNLSPDSKLVFASDRFGYSEIWISDSNGANPVQLTFLKAASHSPKWSPDGKQIAFSSLREGKRHIYVMDGSGGSLAKTDGRPVRVGKAELVTRWPVHLLLFQAAGRQEIWKMSATGGTAVQITSDGGHSGEESPDGEAFFYSKPHELAQGILRRTLLAARMS